MLYFQTNYAIILISNLLNEFGPRHFQGIVNYSLNFTKNSH